MARLPTTKRLLTEDFPEQKDWIPKLLQPLNQNMEAVAAALDKGLTVGENLDGQVVEVTVTEGRFPVSFKATTRTRPKGVLVSNHANLTQGNQSISGALYPIWEYLPATGQIRLTQVYGLNSGEKYRLTLFVHTA